VLPTATLKLHALCSVRTSLLSKNVDAGSWKLRVNLKHLIEKKGLGKY